MLNLNLILSLTTLSGYWILLLVSVMNGALSGHQNTLGGLLLFALGGLHDVFNLYRVVLQITNCLSLSGLGICVHIMVALSMSALGGYVSSVSFHI